MMSKSHPRRRILVSKMWYFNEGCDFNWAACTSTMRLLVLYLATAQAFLPSPPPRTFTRVRAHAASTVDDVAEVSTAAASSSLISAVTERT